jgi:predicted DNA-binding transcriptional regulator AlpA
LTISDVLQQLGISKLTLENCGRDGQFPADVRLGLQVYWLPEALEH